MEWLFILTSIGILAAIGVALTAWGMWLDHKSEIRILEIVAGALESGRDAPQELLTRLAGGAPSQSANGPLAPAGGKALARVGVAFIALGMAFLLGSWMVNENSKEQAFLLVATVCFLVGLALLLARRIGRRFGL